MMDQSRPYVATYVLEKELSHIHSFVDYGVSFGVSSNNRKDPAEPVPVMTHSHAVFRDSNGNLHCSSADTPGHGHTHEVRLVTDD